MKYLKTIGDVLLHYGLENAHYEQVTDKLFRVNDGVRDYALKQSSCTDQTILQWKSLIQFAEKYHVACFLPVYLTMDEEAFVRKEGMNFYLSPWVSPIRQTPAMHHVESFYRAIGNMHHKTKQTEDINMDNIIEIARFFQSFANQSAQTLLQEVEHFEQERFISPFGLLVCTHYRDINLAIRTCKEIAERLATLDQEDSHFPACINHGNLRLSHWIEPYLINWEQAHIGSPVSDLASFFQHEIANGHPDSIYIDAFSVYLEENRLCEKELELLSIYLLNPQEYLSIIKMYHTEKRTTVDYVKRLQQSYRKIMFGLSWYEFVEKQKFATSPDREELS